MHSRWAIPSGSMLSLHRILLVCERGYGEKYSRHIYKRHETEMWLNLLLFSTNEGLSRGTQDRVPQGLEIVPQASVHRSQWKYWVNSKGRRRINCNYFNSLTVRCSLNNTNGWGTEEERIGTLSFVILDKNKNKVWERREWKMFREMVSPIKQLRKCGKKLPKYCDQNNDREITLAEWLNCLESQRLSSAQTSSASPSVLSASQTASETNGE